MHNNCKNKVEKTCKIILTCSIVLCVLSFGTKLYFGNTLAIKNQELRDAFDKKTELEKELISLRFTDSNLSSIEYIERESLRLGFVPLKENVISLDLKEPLQVAALPR